MFLLHLVRIIQNDREIVTGFRMSPEASLRCFTPLLFEGIPQAVNEVGGYRLNCRFA
ncbi:hypothetical protein D3C74_502850 [compost metagenome]